MKKEYLFYTPGGNIFIETDMRRTDNTARKALNLLSAIYKRDDDLFERAKNDRATLDDTKRRLVPYTLTETEKRWTFTSKGGSVVSVPKGTPGYIVLTQD